MEAGDAFRLRGVADKHTWVVVSDPIQNPAQIYCVAFTSHNIAKDRTCIVDIGEYPLLDHRSCIDYFDVKIASDDALEAGISAGLIQRRTSIPTALLRKIRDGFGLTRDTKFEFVEFLVGQGLI